MHGTRTVPHDERVHQHAEREPMPTSRIWLPPDPRPPTTANTANVPASTRPAEVTVVPVPHRPAHRLADRQPLGSSRIRDMTRML